MSVNRSGYSLHSSGGSAFRPERSTARWAVRTSIRSADRSRCVDGQTTLDLHARGAPPGRPPRRWSGRRRNAFVPLAPVV